MATEKQPPHSTAEDAPDPQPEDVKPVSPPDDSHLASRRSQRPTSKKPNLRQPDDEAQAKSRSQRPGPKRPT